MFVPSPAPTAGSCTHLIGDIRILDALERLGVDPAHARVLSCPDAHLLIRCLARAAAAADMDRSLMLVGEAPDLDGRLDPASHRAALILFLLILLTVGASCLIIGKAMLS